jgi:pyruvate,water dikinase
VGNRTFEPPDGGAWELETAHVPRPMSTFSQSSMERAIPRGFREGTSRYGLLLDTIEVRFVQGFAYTRRRPVGTPPNQPPRRKRPPKLLFQLLLRVAPGMRRRIRTSQEAIERKFWRDDLRRWDEQVRPASVKRHLEIQAVDPAKLSDEELIDHILVCRDHMEAMVATHYSFAIASYLPVGDLLANVHEWTGRPAGEILHALQGSSQVSLGVAGAELNALVAALRESVEARRAVESNTDPAEILDALVADPGAVGAAARAYSEVISYRCIGYDVSSKYAREMPELLVRTLRAALVDGQRKEVDPTVRTKAVRALVPEAHRAAFDELVREARHVNRLRDERGHYCDGWATGLARRALLEGGRRLVAKDCLGNPEHAVDVTAEELGTLLRGGSGPSKAEISERAHWRMTRTVSDADVPRWLGWEPGQPPPLDWLPKAARRPQLALRTFFDTLWTESAIASSETCVTGLPVSPGVYEGIARLVHDEADFVRIHKGDVLVTRATSPYFNVVLPLLGAIVTDRGGQLCHAAIVSREYGIPGVVGTREATKVVKDGSRIRVNGTTGEVHVLAEST